MLRLRRLLYGAAMLASLAFLLTFFLAPAVFAADGNASELSLSLALTAAGATIVAGFITGIVEILSRTISPLQGHEQGIALILAAIVVIAAVADSIGKGTMVLGLTTGFAAVVAWYGIARVSMGIHDDTIGRADAGDTALGGAV